MTANFPSFETALADCAGEIDALLGRILDETGAETPPRLLAAMRHAVLGGGKRLRPFLLAASADMFGAEPAAARRTGAALELLHCYSLVHDDLPAMDDDDLRRGKPTVHIAFDEATAILAGDTLLTLAFEVMADPRTHPDATLRAELVTALARAAGGRGMAGGQMLDLEAEATQPDVAGIRRLQSMKTGALLGFACAAGAILGGAAPRQRAALADYAGAIGTAFQIADDLLDVEASTSETGKATGKDAAAGKATLVAALGPEAARRHLDELIGQAIAALEIFGERAEPLRQAARFIASRRG